MNTRRDVDRDNKIITYRFRFEGGEERVFAVHVSRHDDDAEDVDNIGEAETIGDVDDLAAPSETAATMKMPALKSITTLPIIDTHWSSEAPAIAPELPEWTRLGFHQCEDCPLKVEGEARCPPAVDCAAIVHAFESTSSIQLADVIVETPEREVHKRTDMQTAIGSLLGLVMATSGCPILSRFRGLAEFHLPFATPQETLFRAVGAHLLEQYFAHRRGNTPDLDLVGLHSLYETVQNVNRAFVTRVRGAAKQDANLNALVLWFSVSVLITHSVEDGLEDLAEVFAFDASTTPNTSLPTASSPEASSD